MADISGTSGADRQTGGAGNDTIRSSAGDDRIEGGAGDDTYVLNLGRASFVVTSPADGVLVFHPAPGGPLVNFGTDAVSGVESCRLVGPYSTLTVPFAEMMARYNQGYGHAPTAADDKLIGSAGADGINGLGGDDTVEGGHGDDRLDGGPGADVLRGGAGADVFVFRAWEGADDRVEGFEVGVDRLEFHTASGYRPWAVEGAVDGRQGTWVRWGWDGDAVFLAGVTGVGLDALLV
jgi:Ca2+-binding RTX toxin-like protein